MPKSKRRRVRPKASARSGFQHPVEAVTKEELHFALMSGSAVADGKTPRQSFASKFDEAVD